MQVSRRDKRLTRKEVSCSIEILLNGTLADKQKSLSLTPSRFSQLLRRYRQHRILKAESR